MLEKNVKRLLLFLVLAIAVNGLVHPEGESRKDKAVTNSKISGCRILPANNIWNTPIDNMPVDPNSAAYIATIGADDNVHADFGSGLWNGGPIGIPYIVVSGSQAKVDVVFDYDDESDPGPYPIPPDAPIEGGSGSDGDRHVLVLDRDNCILYELYYAFPQGDGSWTAGSGAIYDLKSNNLRPAGWTSADAAGLPILPGLVRYEEVAAGEIDHAIRFTVPQTRRKYIWPARHYASSLTGSQYPPMGQRFRLKASFDISGYSPHAQVILRGLKKYGMILADNGSSWFISGVPDERWNNSVLHQLHNVKGSDFEAVDVSSLIVSANSGAVNQSVPEKTITVTKPNGGENWTAGTTRTIRWTSSGGVGSVSIQYTTGSGWKTVTGSTANDGAYNWTVPEVSSTNCRVRVQEADGDPSDTSNDVFTILSSSQPPQPQPEISLDRSQLNAGAVQGSGYTGVQTFSIANSGKGTLNWQVSDNASWLSVSPNSGSGPGLVSVSIDPTGLSAGLYTGAISVNDANASNSPQTVTVSLQVTGPAQDEPPFGSFATPEGGATVSSSVPVTGWALDDVEVADVEIYRQQGSNLVYIGNATFVEGARPDVETAYPSHPYNYRAGWGYMMLTNFLPNKGNGVFTFHAVATDVNGNQTTLGVTTVTCDNDGAVKPFGAIDTPEQGGTASGSGYINWGWVLTPQPNSIPTDGSTIKIYVDGVYAGHPTYNIYREDIASFFPGYANSSGAVGYFFLDTTAYENGVHTIQWTVTDSGGNTDGIGSRFFSIINSSGKKQERRVGEFTVKPPLNPRVPVRSIQTRELERIQINLPKGVRNGYLVVGERLKPLPIGSTLDRKRCLFSWSVGPGFLGVYRLLFLIRDETGKIREEPMDVTVTPKFR